MCKVRAHRCRITSQVSNWVLCVSSLFSREGAVQWNPFWKLDIVSSNVLINRKGSQGKMGLPPMSSHTLDHAAHTKKEEVVFGEDPCPGQAPMILVGVSKDNESKQLLSRWLLLPVGDTNAHYQEKAENRGVGRKGKWGGGLLPYSFGTFINMSCFHNVFVIIPNFSKMADNTISSTGDLYSE